MQGYSRAQPHVPLLFGVGGVRWNWTPSLTSTHLPSIQLLLGDYLERMKGIPPGSVDMILADLPYGTTACKWDSVIPFEPLWEQYRRIAKPTAAIVLTASQPFTTTLIASNLGEFR